MTSAEAGKGWQGHGSRWWRRLQTVRAAFSRTPRPYLWVLVAYGLPLLLGLPFASRRGPRDHWQRITGLAASGALRQIVCGQPGSQAPVYVVMEHWGIYLSVDGGRTWQPMNRRLPRGSLGTLTVGSLALAPDDAQFVAVDVPGEAVGGRPAVYKTRNGGQFWVPRRGLGTEDVEGLAMAPGNVVYAASGSQLHWSGDGGDTWQEGGKRPTASPVLAMAVDASDGTLYVGAAGDGLWLTRDRGATWSGALAGHSVYAVVVAGAGRLYAGTDDGVYRSADRGTSWQPLVPPGGRGPVVALAARPGSPDRLFVAVPGQPVQYSADGGATWRSLSHVILGAPVTALAVDPQSAERLYVGTRQGLWRCTLSS